MAEQHADSGLVVLAVNAWNEEKDTVAKFVDNHDLKQRMLLSGADVARAYGVKGVPVTLWIDAHGVVTDTLMGFTDAGPLERKTAALVAGSS